MTQNKYLKHRAFVRIGRRWILRAIVRKREHVAIRRDMRGNGSEGMIIDSGSVNVDLQGHRARYRLTVWVHRGVAELVVNGKHS